MIIIRCGMFLSSAEGMDGVWQGGDGTQLAGFALCQYHHYYHYFFFFSSLELSDTKVYEPETRLISLSLLLFDNYY